MTGTTAPTMMTTMTTTGTTTDGVPDGDRLHRRGLSVRTRITATVAVLVTLALAASGMIVYQIESRAIIADIQREVEQELDEFAALQASGDFASIPDLLNGFLERNATTLDITLALETTSHRHPREIVRELAQAVPDPARLALAPPCQARTRAGQPCPSPAVKGKARCRMHGGMSSGVRKFNRNAWKHGGRSAETIAASQYLKAVERLVRE